LTSTIKPLWEAPRGVRALVTTKPYDPRKASIKADLDLPGEPLFLHQCHSSRVITLGDTQTEADGVYTDQPRQVCAVLTADCLPILITNKEGTEIAALHGGWRGLAKGIVKEGLDCFKSSPKELMVWLGPAISQSNYEVGPEVYQAFTSLIDRGAEAFLPSPRENHFYLSLTKAATLLFNQEGVQRIFGGNFCTFEDHQRFYSYRRAGKTGRMATLIWRE